MKMALVDGAIIEFYVEWVLNGYWFKTDDPTCVCDTIPVVLTDSAIREDCVSDEKDFRPSVECVVTFKTRFISAIELYRMDTWTW